MKVWITGAGGSLGNELIRVFRAAKWEVVGTERADIDITHEEMVMAFVNVTKPDAIVNAAAYNAVDAAEDEGRDLAFSINGKAPGFLARAAHAVHAIFVHVSTDYVFSGDRRTYIETDSPDPISAYGESKAFGEMGVREFCDAHTASPMYVIRTSKLFGPRGISASAKRSFVEVMLEKARAGEVLALVDDEAGCPTYTPHLADAIFQLVQQRYAESGVYHLVNEGDGVTWYQFAKEIFEAASLNPEMKPVSSNAFVRKANRPHAVILKNTKLSPLPSRLDALRQYLAQTQ